MKPSNDKEAITLILQGAVDAGVTLTTVIDDTWNKDEEIPVSSVQEAVDLITNVDEAFFRCILPNGESAWGFFVLGNDPEEVLNNCTVNLSPFVDPIINPWWK